MSRSAPDPDAAKDAAGLRDRTTIEPPGAPYHPMRPRLVPKLDTAAIGQDIAELDASDLALEAAERDAAAPAVGRR